MDEIVASDMGAVGARKARQSTKMKGMDGLCYRRVFNRDDLVKCYMLKELKLTAWKMLTQKAMSDAD